MYPLFLQLLFQLQNIFLSSLEICLLGLELSCLAFQVILGCFQLFFQLVLLPGFSLSLIATDLNVFLQLQINHAK